MHTLYRISILTIAALFACTPGKVCADRKNKRPAKAVYLVAPEPDKLPPVAIKSKVIQTPNEAHIGNHWDNIAREGIDVSHYQGIIDWREISKNKNIGYVYIKSTEGESLVDDTYRYNIEGARKAGLKVGSYHYYRPNADMNLQFENLTSQVKAEEQDLAIIIDVETRGRKSHESFISDLKAFLKRVEQHYKSKPVVYTFQNFYNKYMSGEFKDYPLMIAKYHDEEPVLADGQSYNLWQYTSKGEIDGIEGYVDRSKVMPDFSISDISFR